MASKSFKGERFSRIQADGIVDELVERIRAEKLFVGGSYVRQQPDCGDIDIAILENELTLGSIEDLAVLWDGEYLVNGQKVKRLVLTAPSGLRFQLDLWLISDPGQWGPLVMFVAGSGNFNKMQRVHAIRAGCTLTQYAVLKDGVPINRSMPEEMDVYDYFGWDWVPYNKRSLG